MQQNNTIPFLDLPLPLLHEIAHRLPIQTWHSIHLVSRASNEKWKHVENSNSILKQRILDRVSIKSHPTSESFRSKFIEIIFSEDFLRSLTLRAIDVSHCNELDKDSYQQTCVDDFLSKSGWSTISPFSFFLDITISYARGNLEILKRIYMHKDATDISALCIKSLEHHFQWYTEFPLIQNFLTHILSFGHIQQDIDFEEAFHIATMNEDAFFFEKMRSWVLRSLHNKLDLAYSTEDDLKVIPRYMARILLTCPSDIQTTIWDCFPDYIKTRIWRLIFFRLLTSANIELATKVFEYGSKDLDSHSRIKLSICPAIILFLIRRGMKKEIEWLDKHLSVKFEPVHLYVAVVHRDTDLIRFLLYEKNVDPNQKFLSPRKFSSPRNRLITCIQTILFDVKDQYVASYQGAIRTMSNREYMKLFFDHPNFDVKYLNEEAPFDALQSPDFYAIETILTHPKCVINYQTCSELSYIISDWSDDIADIKNSLLNLLKIKSLIMKSDCQQSSSTNKRKRTENF